MNYINQYGQSIGPIKIDSTWIFSKRVAALAEANREEMKYLGFTYSKNDPKDSNYVPLLARTPILGTYKRKNEDDSTTWTPCAPLNAVATVEWVVAYASLAPGEMAGVDIDRYVTIDMLKEIESELKLLISDLDEELEELTLTVTSNENRITENENSIKINRDNITALTARMTKAESDIKINADAIKEMQDNPFPNGLWLICGEVE